MKSFLRASVISLGLAFFGSNASAITLEEAVAIAVKSNPEIGQAVQNREAIEFELRQARGLYLPSIDLEAFGGGRRLASPTRTEVGFLGTGLTPAEVSVVVTQTLYNSGGRRAEVDRQASRVDGASLRVLERSSAIALQIVEEYLEYCRLLRIKKQAVRNLEFHRKVQKDINSAASAGTLTDADRQQVKERVLAATARLKETEEALSATSIRFLQLVGVPLEGSSTVHPEASVKLIPANLTSALTVGKEDNSRIRVAKADVDTADAEVRAAKARRGPEILAEARGRIGHDVDGSDGRTDDVQGRVIARWNIFRGGIDKAAQQEEIRRASEQRLVLTQVYREVDAAIRISWDRRKRQYDLVRTFQGQAKQNALLVNSYNKQFGVGQRSLLDVLDAQNTRFNVEVLKITAQLAAEFTEFQLLAATGQLLKSFDIAAPAQSEAYARPEFNVPPTADESIYVRAPSRQYNKLPFDLLGPIRNAE